MDCICSAFGRIALALDYLARLAIVVGALVLAGDMIWRTFTHSSWFGLLAAPAAVTAVFLIQSFRNNPRLVLRPTTAMRRRPAGE